MFAGLKRFVAGLEPQGSKSKAADALDALRHTNGPWKGGVVGQR